MNESRASLDSNNVYAVIMVYVFEGEEPTAVHQTSDQTREVSL